MASGKALYVPPGARVLVQALKTGKACFTSQLTTQAWGGEIIKKIKLECFKELKAEGHKAPCLDDI